LRKFLIATHGTFACGIKSSLDIIMVNSKNIFIIEAYVDGNKSIEDALNNIKKKVNGRHNVAESFSSRNSHLIKLTVTPI
jgi:mannose/fructose-specific phosphotransferase system component IIA